MKQVVISVTVWSYEKIEQIKNNLNNSQSADRVSIHYSYGQQSRETPGIFNLILTITPLVNQSITDTDLGEIIRLMVSELSYLIQINGIEIGK